jgi:hypothetical protein
MSSKTRIRAFAFSGIIRKQQPKYAKQTLVELWLDGMHHEQDAPISKQSQSVCHDTLRWLIFFSLGR